MDDQLILVNEQDKEIGYLDKFSVHQKGILHRAFSVFVFNSGNEILLQQRADDKYHSPGLWSNTCCSHPRPGEETISAAKRRLKEEMHIECALELRFNFTYEFEFPNGLKEHEFDHVFFGRSNNLPTPDPAEVKSWKYMNFQDLEVNISQQPQNYTAWLKICLPKVKEHLQSQA
jgi:isopentenyl-diphosphate delta-isomerase